MFSGKNIEDYTQMLASLLPLLLRRNPLGLAALDLLGGLFLSEPHIANPRRSVSISKPQSPVILGARMAN